MVVVVIVVVFVVVVVDVVIVVVAGCAGPSWGVVRAGAGPALSWCPGWTGRGGPSTTSGKC